MTIQEAQQVLITGLKAVYDDREAALIADWVLEHVTGNRKLERLLNKGILLPQGQKDTLERYTRELSKGRPVQYVLHESWFCGMKFYVDERVLIPRPETEELVEWVLEEMTGNPLTIMDIGTGSGCIPISIQKKLFAGGQSDSAFRHLSLSNAPTTKVYGCDISQGALEIAALNNTTLQAEVSFLQADFLDPEQRQKLPDIDILVSNPPYIPLKDKEEMARHVVDFEPHQALFVTNEDPLVFYRALAEFAGQKGKPGGKLYAEIHEQLGEEVVKLFETFGFQSITLKKDMQGKDRMIKATW